MKFYFKTQNEFQKKYSPFRNSTKRKFSKSPFQHKSALSISKWVTSPLAKRGKVTAARDLFTNTYIADNEALVEEDLYFPISCIQESENENKEKESLIDELIKIPASVRESISKYGNKGEVIVYFFRIVNEQKFPLENMSLQLQAEHEKWFSSGKTCNMRYSEQTKIFWKLGCRLFGAKFIYFIGGYKNEGVFVHNLSNSPTPEFYDINFFGP